MEDPLCQTSNGKSHQATRKTSSALETRSPATPDFAVIEELEELSNTLDDLMESLGDSSDNSPKVSQIQSPSVREIKDLCTTIDYLLDTSEEEQLNREFNALETRPKDETNVEHSKSAFTKVLTPSQKRRILPSEPKLHVDKAVAVVDKAPTVSLSSESNKNSQQIARKASDSNVNKNRRHDSKARRRKLPQQPVANSRPSEESSEPTKGKAPTGKENEARLARQISQESLTLIKRRFGSESNLSSLKYDSKEEPKRYNKTDKLKEGIRSQSKNKSLPSNKRTSSESGSSTNVRKAALKKAQSEVDVFGVDEKKHNQQLKKDQSSIKNVSADSFKKPTVQEASERTSVSRQSSRSESLNSDGSSNVKGRPPSGVGMRTRSTRAKKRQEIVQKLECLETSLNSLEKSPKKKSSRNSSTSSSTSRLSAKDVAVTSSTRKLDLHRTNSFGCKTSENIKNTSTLRTRSQSASASTTNGAAKGKARTAGKTGTKAQLPAPVQTKEKESKIAKEKIVASKKAENVANVTNGPEKSKESGKMNGKVTKEKRIVSEMNNHDKMKRSVGEVGIPSNPAPEIITDRVCKDDKENTVDNMQDESKVQIKLKDTGSWMVLDYEGRANGSEPSTRNNSVSSQASQFSVHTNTDDVIATSNTLITVNPREPLDNEESCKKVNGDVVIAEEALQDGEMVRHNALRTRKTRRKVETQNALSFGNGKEKLPVKNSTAKTSKNEKSTKGPKNKGNISFGIRKKKITESCHEINGKLTTDTHVNTPNSPLNRSLEKKKHSPFKLLAIKRKSSESQSLKNA